MTQVVTVPRFMLHLGSLLRYAASKRQGAKGLATQQGHVSVVYLDSLGVKTAVPYYVNIDDSKTVAAALGEVGSLAGALDAVSDSKIVETTLHIGGPLPGAGKSAPVAGSLNNRGEILNFKQTGIPDKYGVLIPAIALSKLTGARLNLSDTDVTNLLTLLTTAGTVFTYVSNVFRVLATLIDSLLSIRKHRKPDSRVSFEPAP